MYSDTNSSTEPELLELTIHTLLVKTRTRDLDREVYFDPNSDRYLFPSEKIFENAADDLEIIAVSNYSMSLLRQEEAVRIDLEQFKEDTQPLAKNWCIRMEDDAHQRDEMNGHLRVMKTCMKARYILLDRLGAQRNDRMSNRLKMWIEKGVSNRGHLEKNSYRS